MWVSTHLRIYWDHATLAFVIQGLEQHGRFFVEDFSISINRVRIEPSGGDTSMLSPGRLVSLTLFDVFGCLPSIVVWCGGDTSTSEDCLALEKHFFARRKDVAIGDHQIFRNRSIGYNDE